MAYFAGASPDSPQQQNWIEVCHKYKIRLGLTILPSAFVCLVLSVDHAEFYLSVKKDPHSCVRKTAYCKQPSLYDLQKTQEALPLAFPSQGQTQTRPYSCSMPHKWLVELVPHWSIRTKCFSTKCWWSFPPNPRCLNFGLPSARASKQLLLEGPSLNEAGLRLRRSLAHSPPFPHTSSCTPLC